MRIKALQNVLLFVLPGAMGLACSVFATDCSDKDALCNDGFLTILAYQTYTPILVTGDDLGNVHVSYDGLNWQSVPVVPGSVTTDITYARGAFWLTTRSAPGFGQVFYSNDGLNWSVATSGLETLNEMFGIAYGAGRFVALGQPQVSADGAFSNDGINWTINNDAALTLQDFVSASNPLSYTNNLFIAGDVGGGNVVFSNDGINWTQGLPASSNPEDFSSIGGQYFWSDQLQLWSGTVLTGGGPPPAVPGLTGIRAAAAHPTGIGIAAGDAAVIHVSRDGRNWSTSVSPGGTAALDTATADAPRLLFVGGATGTYYISRSQGNSWIGPLSIPGATGNLKVSAARPGHPYDLQLAN